MKIDYLKRFLTLGIFYFSIAFLVFNCEKDDGLYNPEPQAHKLHKHTSHHVVYKNEIQDNQKLLETLHKLKSYDCISSVKENSNVSSKLVYNETLNITIDDESAIYFESHNGAYHSYTFQAIDHEHPYGVQNIVISLMPDGSYKELLIRYEVEGEEEQAFRNGETIDLTGKVSYAVLENGSFASTVLNKVTTVNDCITVTAEQIGRPCTGQQHHTWEQRYDCPLLGTVDGPVQNIPFSVDIDYDCIDSFNNTGNGESLPDEYNEYQDPNWTPADGASTVPYVSPIELTRRKVFRQISLTDELREWFDNQSTEYKNDIYSFLESKLTPNQQLNDVTYSESGIVEARLNLWTDYANDPIEDPKWIPQVGMLQNNPSLSYTHYLDYFDGVKAFLLKDGKVIAESDQKLPVNDDFDYGIALLNSEQEFDNYYYTHSGDKEDKEWFAYAMPEYGLNFECLSCALNQIATQVLENGLVITGRYFLPAEDLIIFIYGEDFYGVEQSRAVAGVFLLMEVIPGSDLLKLTKLTKHVDEASQITEVIIKHIDEIYQQQKKVIQDVLDGITPLTNNTKRGNFGEIVVDVDLYERGYISLTRDSVVDLTDTAIHTNGIDNIVFNPQTGEYILIETKYNTATLSQTAEHGMQMSSDWIGHHLQNLPQHVRDEISLNGYTSVLAEVATDGSITYSILDDAAETIGAWIP